MYTRQPSVWLHRIALCVLYASLSMLTTAVSTRAQDVLPCFGVRVVDDRTGRGVPLVELETVNHLKWVTDSAGWVALREQELMGQTVFLYVRSHGYTFPKDGFGYAGTRVDVRVGRTQTIKIHRVNLAERMYRITGQGIYRDSVCLDEPVPLAKPLGRGKVVGQDSAFAELYRGRIMWFWGDTMRMSYPLGHFWMAAATSALPAQGGLDPAVGVDLDYFIDKDGFSRPVLRLGVEKGPIWADGFHALSDAAGLERLVCHYAHMESLTKVLDHGLAVYNDEKQEFERLKALDMRDRHLFPAQAHPIRYRENDVEYIGMGEVFPTVRVQADWDHYIDPATYEAYTCIPGNGDARYLWVRGAKPIDGAGEQELIDAGRLKAEQAHFLPRDVDSGKTVCLHRGSVRWNAWRRRWIMIAVQRGGSSFLGEVWYAEADAITGPWLRARKILTHDRYSFYNPVHHAFFDSEGGRIIYFEGTYAQTFSGNPVATPRYDYNQIMYRLDLSDPRLMSVRQGTTE